MMYDIDSLLESYFEPLAGTFEESIPVAEAIDERLAEAIEEIREVDISDEALPIMARGWLVWRLVVAELRSGLIQHRLPCSFTEFRGRRLYVLELLAERFEGIVGDGDQLDPVLELDDVVVVSVPLSDFFGESETTLVVKRDLDHTRKFVGVVKTLLGRFQSTFSARYPTDERW